MTNAGLVTNAVGNPQDVRFEIAKLIETTAADRSWTPDTVISALTSFISVHGNLAELRAHLKAVVANEDSYSLEEFTRDV